MPGRHAGLGRLELILSFYLSFLLFSPCALTLRIMEEDIDTYYNLRKHKWNC